MCNTLQRTRALLQEHTSLVHMYTALLPHSTHQHTATHCNTLQYTVSCAYVYGFLASQHTATHCNTLLQNTATRCNTLSLVQMYTGLLRIYMALLADISIHIYTHMVLYTCIYVYTYVFVYFCGYIYIYIYIYIHTYEFACMHICIHVCI